MPVLFVKQRSSVSEPPFRFRGLRGNVCDLSLARQKARGRLPIGYYRTFSLVLTAYRKKRRNRPLLKGMGHFEVEGLSLQSTSMHHRGMVLHCVP